MKKKNSKIGVTVLLLFFTNLFFAQNQKKIDSLQHLLDTTISDSIKVKLYGNLSWIYINTRIKTDIARQYADSIKHVAEVSNNPHTFSRYHFYAGVIDRIESNYENGLEHFKKYVEYHKDKGDSTRVARGLYHVASINKYMGNYEKSLSTQYRVLAIQETEKDSSNIATTTQAIGSLLFEIKRYQDAIEHHNKALKIFIKIGEKENVAGVNISLGNTYLKMNQLENAKINYQNALNIYNEINRKWGVALAYANLAFMYEEMKNYSLALEYHLKGLELRKTMPNKENLTRSLIAVGRGYKALEKYTKAKQYLKQAMKKALNIKSKPLIRDTQNNLTELYVLEKDFLNAYESQVVFNKINDSIFNETKSRQIAELQTKYETAQKDKEIELLTKENQLKEATSEKEATLRKTLIAGLVLLAIIGSLIFYTMRQRLRNQKMLVEKNEEIKRSQYREQLQTLEMKALRAQMNPHFLFNSLNSINTMIISDDNDNASKYLSKFSKLVRLMLENSEQPRVSLHDEINMLETYIQLEILRFNNKIEYNIEIDESIDQDGTYIPSMVLQPFVENAIWHGLLHKDKKGLLTITIKEDKDNLLCSITDNGIGREKSLTLQKDVSLKKTSMGIKITTDRLKLLTKQTINDVISIIDLKDKNNNALGTKVNIQIPIS